MLQSGVLSGSTKLDAKEYYSNRFVFSNENAQKQINYHTDQKTNDWSVGIIVGVIGTLFGIVGVILAYLGWMENKKQRKLDFIDSLDDFAKKLLDAAGTAKTIKLSIPTPLLHSFRYKKLGDSEFTYENYIDSFWWKKFAAEFLNKISGAPEKLDLTLLILNKKQSQNYAKKLLNSDDLATIHSNILEEFIDELKTKCNLTIERLYTIPYWSAVIDPGLDRTGQAIVCFSDPDMVIKRTMSNGTSPDDIANELKGILVKEQHAVKYFSDSFNDMQTRHYFHEVVEEIREQLETKHDIDMAFVKKWEKKTDNLHDWEPHEVIMRRKPS